MDKQDKVVVYAALVAALFLVGIGVNECRAADLHVQLHGASAHMSPRANGLPWNERNWGGGVRAQLTPDWGVQAGTYQNSFNRVSKYAFVQYTPIDFGSVRAGAFAGYLSGYNLPAPVGAGAMATWQVTTRLSTTLRYVPPLGKGTSGVWAFELGMRL